MVSVLFSFYWICYPLWFVLSTAFGIGFQTRQKTSYIMLMKLLRIEPAHNSKKKWRAVFDETHTEFGDSSSEDYTQHKDKERRRLYRLRHEKDLKTNDPTRAGYLSYFILWNKPTMKASISDYKKQFNL